MKGIKLNYAELGRQYHYDTRQSKIITKLEKKMS